MGKTIAAAAMTGRCALTLRVAKSETTSEFAKTSIMASSAISSFMAVMSKPYTSSQNFILSSFILAPSIKESKIEHWLGTISPVGFMNLSLAWSTLSSMHSYSKK